MANEINNPNDQKNATQDKPKSVFQCPIYFGKSQIDMEIKRFFVTIDDDGKIATTLKNILKSFILGVSYKWESPDKIDERTLLERKGIKLSFSKLHDDILFNWFKEYVVNSINVGGILKNIIHFQLYKNRTTLQIDVEQFRKASNKTNEQIAAAALEPININEVPKSKIKKETKEKTKKLLSQLG